MATVPGETSTTPAAWAEEVLLADLRAGLLRQPRIRHGGSAPRAEVDGRPVVVLSSNDYLGLSTHPAVRDAAARAARELGVGATGSRHLSGCHAAITELEGLVCAFEGSDAATLAPSGYAANVAALEALGGPDAVIFSDELNHASIIDGCRASRSRVEVYRHRDLDDLEARLREVPGRPVIVSDTVFSMEGAAADVRGLAELARAHGAWLVLDEAHATGVLGPGGRGLCAEQGVAGEEIIRIVTFSKALGTSGAAICGSETVRQLLLQRGRALIYSTALPHPSVAAAHAALEVLGAHPELVERLRHNAALVRERLGAHALGDAHPHTPIVAVIVGDAMRAMELDEAMWDRGFLVQGLRPPTVEPGRSRLRMVATAAHREEDLLAAAGTLAALLEGA